MIPIPVTREAYDEAPALSRFITIFPDHTPDGEYLIWVDPATHSRLTNAVRNSGDTYSDVIIRWVATGRCLHVFDSE